MRKSGVIIGDEMKILTHNKKAFHEFFVSDLLEAGIALEGYEVKSVRAGGISLNDAFVIIKDGEAFLKNCYIKPYEHNSDHTAGDSATRRTRKLLLHKAQIHKLARQILEKGFTVIPTKAYLDRGMVKIEIGLGKGKKLYDKREVLKDKQIQRDLDRTLKEY